jgi:hypothetical protein
MECPKLSRRAAVELLQAIGGLSYSFKKNCSSGRNAWALCRLVCFDLLSYSEQPLVHGNHPGECLVMMWPELMCNGHKVLGRWEPKNYKGHKYVKPAD